MAKEQEEPQERRSTVSLESGRIYRHLDSINEKLEKLIRLEARQQHLEQNHLALKDRVHRNEDEISNLNSKQTRTDIRLAQMEGIQRDVEALMMDYKSTEHHVTQIQHKQSGFKLQIDTILSIAKVIMGLLIAMGLFAGYANQSKQAPTPVKQEEAK